jgi:hypothetical protein
MSTDQSGPLLPPDHPLMAAMTTRPPGFPEPTFPPPLPVRDRILNVVSDLVGDFMYYDRKESEHLPVGAIEQAIADGVITVDEIVAKFREGVSADA